MDTRDEEKDLRDQDDAGEIRCQLDLGVSIFCTGTQGCQGIAKDSYHDAQDDKSHE